MELTQGVRFDTLELSPEILRALMERNIVQSTPVQAGCIPPMLEWRDVIAKAPTGTGKTFAYGIPIVEHIDPEDESVQAVILAPTRELAIQITDELRILYTYKPGIRAVCLYGGAPIGRQIDALKKHPQIVVATPGRLSDHMKRRTVRVDTAQTVVLDEADRMLDMGFIHDVTRLLDRMDKRKNLGLFSATISREVMDIAWVYQRDAEEVTVREDEQNKPDIKQFRMDVSFDGKAEAIAKILNETGFDRCMVFCNTKGNTERITKFLWRPVVSTWMMWTSCSTATFPMKIRTMSTGSAVPAGPSGRAWPSALWRTSPPRSGSTILPRIPAMRSCR